ncbi:hypothetical protein CWB93_13000 [Pseudoalteromonas piscicida]|uniref:Uncharacterized protein n=1 Tax=Pseudoalteromonas piscicida TaxID=43662 RepID=A0AAQ2ISW9_PSEO7|nr:hypothetical protein TW75_03935 [Pseudoalteromonas piscicida]TMN45819.1 hypothetical protein CWB95_00425 [Pseudoalteromonas piscicida]TMN47555.1 hypothetical protein CWB91_20900 [Pseudoalteromonas piscicida]TMN54704.1 hypothetical protein CWB93_13000 [Pseudoalteromonas piscicida]TMN57633.1 hypothetical protein CWB92_00425 [Pseudoalteromonas piscicida]
MDGNGRLSFPDKTPQQYRGALFFKLSRYLVKHGWIDNSGSYCRVRNDRVMIATRIKTNLEANGFA